MLHQSLTIWGIFASEVCLLFFQVIYTLFRPNDIRRKQFLIFLLLIIQFNLACALLPKNQTTGIYFSIPIIKYLSGFIMATYFLYYLENNIGLNSMRPYLNKRNLLPTLSIFVFSFILPLLLTEHLLLSNRLLLLLPLIYCIRLIYGLTREIQVVCPAAREINTKTYIEIVTTYLAAISWVVVAITLFRYGIDERTMKGINLGFLFIVIAYFNNQFRLSKKEDLLIRNESEDMIRIALRLEKTNSLLDKLRKQFYDLDFQERAETPNLNSFLKNQLNEIQTWKEFDKLLELTHQNFYRKLKSDNPELNKKEIRHLCLIKLQYSPDEIAYLLEVKKESLRTLRSLLKKKMGLKERSLFEYLDSI